MRQPAWEPKSKRPPHSHPAGVRRVGVWVHADWLSGIAHWLKRHARMAQVQRTSCFSSASSNSFFSFAFCMNFMPKTRPLRAGLDMAYHWVNWTCEQRTQAQSGSARLPMWARVRTVWWCGY